MLFEDKKYNHTGSGFLRRHGWWLFPLLVFDLFFLIWWLVRDQEDQPQVITEEVVTAPAAAAKPQPPPGLIIGFATVQENLFETNSTVVYMPTASGRIESAFYGSTRTRQQGSAVVASFHEGIDIAPVERGKKNAPLDRIFAIADGRVAYISPHPGNSNYGRYVVTVHDDDAFGEIYALYAHLDDIADGLRAGQAIARGHDLGRLGSSPSHIVPVARAHLHLEIGVILNQHFQAWHKKQKLKPDHRNYHGHNLYGIDPLDVYRISAENEGRFSMRDYLLELKPAFTLLFRANARPDYYRRYAALWTGDDEPAHGAVVMAVSEGGVPLRGRPASAEEVAGLGRASYAVLSVDEDVLGRNGMRLIITRQGKRILSSKGEGWLEIITYRP